MLHLKYFIRRVYLRFWRYGRNDIPYLDPDSIYLHFEGLKINAGGGQPLIQSLRRNTQCPSNADMETR